MLEMLQAAAGHRVLEIGTGSGYNAALLAVIVGDSGIIVTVEIEPELLAQAKRSLQDAGICNVEALLADGAKVLKGSDLFDRIVVTTGAQEVAEVWCSQLVEGGRLVVPVVDETGLGLIKLFERVQDQLLEIAATPCGFLPMRHGSPN